MLWGRLDESWHSYFNDDQLAEVCPKIGDTGRGTAGAGGQGGVGERNHIMSWNATSPNHFCLSRYALVP